MILRCFQLTAIALAFSFPCLLQGQDQAASQRLQESRLFHAEAGQGTGLLIPLYLYPANIHTNEVFNRLIELKRRYERIPFWVIVNPASGPGLSVDVNYVKAIDRLRGAGCTVLGYVTTSYGKRSVAEVTKDVKQWLALYPTVHGIFYDEMIYENDPTKVAYQLELRRVANELGCWPNVANPGTDTPGAYFEKQVADVIVVYEGSEWPDEKRLHGDYFGSYSDYPPWTRGVLVHSMKTLSKQQVNMIRKYSRWIYVTEDPYTQRDPKADNPWDSLSAHVEEICKLIQQP